MKKYLALALALVLVCVCGLALADETDITVQGSAQLYATPDIAYVTANASVRAETISAAQEQVDAVIAAATGKLLALGVADEDIVTDSYSYHPNYTYDTDAPTLTNYQANHTLRITCRDLDKLSSAIDALTQGGMTEIYGVSYDISNRPELYRQALVMAMSAAKSKAELMAQAEGMTLGVLESVTENGGYADYRVNVSADTGMAKAEGAGIRTGTVTVSASVTSVYEAALGRSR